MKIIFRYDYFDEEFYGYEEIPVEEELTPQFQTSPSKLKVLPRHQPGALFYKY